MARFTSDFKQAFLIALWEKAPAGGTTLLEAITALLLAQFELVSGGLLISSVSGAGHSTSFFVPTGAGLSPQTLLELAGELRRVYTESAAALATADEEAIYPEMLNRLQAVRHMRDDFSCLTR